ncbi:MAG: LysR family transcriptional regulator [Hyphomicrobiales bacterium]|nr:LysR family transcriptional regulator [Hyphomicrobiales bacterium]
MLYFVKTVEAGNITAAAEALQLAQPALGSQIRLLERELGVPLLVRHSRGVTPTAAGTLLFERASSILAEVDETKRQIRELAAGSRDHITLGVTPSMVMLLGPDLLLQARNRAPGISISLVEERSPVLLEALEAGHIDIAFLYHVAERPNLVRKALIEEDLLFVTGPDEIAGEEPISLARALEHELAIAGERGVIRRIVEAEAARLSLKVRLAFEVHSVRSMKALLARGTAASVMPWSLAAEELSAGMLHARRIDRPALTRVLYIVEPANRRSIAMEAELSAFLDHVSTRMLELIGPYARSLK